MILTYLFLFFNMLVQVLAVNQDALGVQGTLRANRSVVM